MKLIKLCHRFLVDLVAKISENLTGSTKSIFYHQNDVDEEPTVCRAHLWSALAHNAPRITAHVSSLLY